ncbi:hypothetical protein AVW15_07145 [Chelatococcus daeguensis]|uniref:Uncharacterized protein n=2 Tax=Chelatococcus TaxID=28209 RepID=A0AAC9JVM9_9HYPH|nr:hypothetical protein BOQ54_12565 [Chelatococcus daeguensis]KZE28562.1 hypothetical protein AVW15_07145 [Chelatococcus daeguensis]
MVLLAPALAAGAALMIGLAAGPLPAHGQEGALNRVERQYRQSDRDVTRELQRSQDRQQQQFEFNQMRQQQQIDRFQQPLRTMECPRC